MPFEVAEITTFEDFMTIQSAQDQGYSDPFFGYWELLKGPSEKERVERFWHIHQATPGSHWIKVRDPISGEVAGGANWILNENDPFQDLLMIPRASWWPEDDDRRDIANQMMHQFFSERPKRQARPHMLLSIIFIVPQHRRHGLGTLLMKWGIDRADEADLEAFVEGTPLGVALYSSFGFVRVGEVVLSPQNHYSSASWDETWKQIAPADSGNNVAVVMWRPKGGNFVPGQTRYSWEKKVE